MSARRSCGARRADPNATAFRHAPSSDLRPSRRVRKRCLDPDFAFDEDIHNDRCDFLGALRRLLGLFTPTRTRARCSTRTPSRLGIRINVCPAKEQVAPTQGATVPVMATVVAHVPPTLHAMARDPQRGDNLRRRTMCADPDRVRALQTILPKTR